MCDKHGKRWYVSYSTCAFMSMAVRLGAWGS